MVALGGYLVLMLVLTSFLTVPRWIVHAAGIAYVTLPQAVLTRWAWNKPAIRLPSGRVLARNEARRLAIGTWAVDAAVLAWRLSTW